MEPQLNTEFDPDPLDAQIWGLIDQTIDNQEVAELETRLASDQSARERYLACCNLHADLLAEFRPPVDSPASASPVLGSLADVFRGIDDRPPVS
ncbi:MAG: hypothetical protein AAGA92_01555 [Planctomycetota bacterium]